MSTVNPIHGFPGEQSSKVNSGFRRGVREPMGSALYGRRGRRKFPMAKSTHMSKGSETNGKKTQTCFCFLEKNQWQK